MSLCLTRLVTCTLDKFCGKVNEFLPNNQSFSCFFIRKCYTCHLSLFVRNCYFSFPAGDFSFFASITIRYTKSVIQCCVKPSRRLYLRTDATAFSVPASE